MGHKQSLVGVVSAVGLFTAACGGTGLEAPTELPSAPPSGELQVEEGAFSSAQATLLDFTFDGVLFTRGSLFGGAQQVVKDQLLYTIGHLNGEYAVGRLDKLTLTNVKTETQPNGETKVTYRAVMPVGWNSKTRFPTSYEFRLPRDASASGFAAFTSKYSETCVDASAHDVSSGSMWYYYRPEAAGCELAETDIVRIAVSAIVKSPENTTGKYPEYDKVWEDDALEVVSIFGKYEDGTTTDSDAGIAAYNRFVGQVRQALVGATSVKTTPAQIPTSPGVAVPDVTFEATLTGGRKVKITALLLDSVTAGSPDFDFDARYSALSPTADLIAYNGHAGLGQNVRALARKGRFVSGQYLMLFMNGCDTFAYVDGSLAQSRASLNPDDPTGSKYLDIVTNVMPSFFHSMPSASMALIKGLMNPDAPKTYEQMFRSIDRQQVVVVTGEEDNVYTP